MRAAPILSALLLTCAVSGCAALAGFGGDAGEAGPPEWFLRTHEKAQLTAVRAQAQTAATPSSRFAVATPLSPEAYGARLGAMIERCWIGGQPGWSLKRAPGDVALALMETPPKAPTSEARLALGLSIVKSEGPGLEVRTEGALGAGDHRPRLRRALERAKTVNPAAPNCAVFTEVAESPR